MEPIPTRTFLARCGVVDGRWVDGLRVDVDAAGDVVLAGAAVEHTSVPFAPSVRDWGHAMVVPGFVDAHSHAFQRGIRGATHRRGAGDPSSFWSWRTRMYEAANALDPDGVHDASRVAFAEMLRAGITTVGEFHYLHHRPDGGQYDDPHELSWQVARAAADVGIRLVLLEVYYARAGAGPPPLPEQRRFCDGDVASFLARVEAVRARGIPVGIAPHSVRAVDRAALAELAGYARDHALPLHVHVSEQPRENEECAAEHGMSPVCLLAECGAMSRPRGLTAVHAIHLDDADRSLLADQCVCACPTTEADLGDGIVAAAELRAAGCELALGSDSNAVIDLVQEARLLEMHERLRAQARLRLFDDDGRVWPVLLRAATRGGAIALGHARGGEISRGAAFDAAVIDLGHPFFSRVEPGVALDALLLAGTAAAVAHVVVGGVELV
jgi:formimidoylglutamate deiminase